MTASTAEAGVSTQGAATVVEAEKGIIDGTDNAVSFEEPEHASEEAGANIGKVNVQNETQMEASGVATSKGLIEKKKKLHRQKIQNLPGHRRVTGGRRRPINDATTGPPMYQRLSEGVETARP